MERIVVDLKTGTVHTVTITQEEIDQLPGAEPVRIPEAVSRFQARAALLQAGLYSQVQEYMNRADTPQITILAWNDAQEFRRDSPTVAALAGLLSLTDSQLDALFLQASQIEA